MQQVTYRIDGLALPFVDQIRDIGVYHDCRLKYDKHIYRIVDNAYLRAVLILKCFHTWERDILTLAFGTYVRTLLEFSCHIWVPLCNYLIDKIESVQIFFARRIRGLEKLSYNERLNILGLKQLTGAVSFSIWFYVTNICMILSKLITVILYVFTGHLELEVTEWNCVRNSATSMRDITRDINCSVILLVIYGIL